VIWFVVALLAVAAVLFIATVDGQDGRFFADWASGRKKARTWLKKDKAERPALRDVFAAPTAETVPLAELLSEGNTESGYLEPEEIVENLTRAKDRVSGAFRRVG
jgi:hypothetical protein